MAHEKTVVLIKPDGVAMGVVDDIISRYLKEGLAVADRKTIRFSRAQATSFYAEHAGRFYFPGTVLAMTSGPCEALLLAGDSAVGRVRALHGPTDPKNAPEGTIRRDFRSAGGPFNTVHGSDSPEAAEREWAIVNSI